jgi:ABC-type nitrate/sulfonate/bicarbonate transport system substrate-binding protein
VQVGPGRRTRGRRGLLVSVLTVIGLVASACGGGDSDSAGGGSGSGGSGSGGSGGSGGDLGTLRVVTVVPNSLLFIGVQAAEQLGTWEGTGLEVEVVNGTSPTAGQIMASGEADIGLMDGNRAAANIVQGLDATIMGSCISPWVQYIIASNQSGATKVEDLKGGTFGISGEGSGGHYSAAKVAESLGWSEDEWTATPLGNLESLRAALQSGAIDAFAWSSTTAFNLDETGEGKVLDSAVDYVGPNVFEAFAVMNDVAAERPEAVRAFFEGYYAAIERLQEDPQLAVDILVDDWDVNPAAAERAVEADVPELSTDGEVSSEELEGLADAVTFVTGEEAPDPSEFYEYWQDALKG